MESFRKVEPALTVTNTAGLIGLAFYVYKSVTSLQAQQAKLSDALQATIETVGNLRKKDNSDSLVRAIQELDKAQQDIKRSIEETPSLDEFEDLLDRLDLVSDSVEKGGIQIETPRPTPSYRRDPKPIIKSNRGSRRKPPTNNRRRVSFQDEPSLDEGYQDDPPVDDAVNLVRSRRRRR